MRVPLFVERTEQPETMLCRKIVAALFAQRISPLPFAANAREFSDVCSALQARHTPPAVFVINTADAAELLTQIERTTDPNIPMLLFHRQFYSEAAMSPVAMREAGVARVIERITRKKCVWAYGGLTVDAVARTAAEAIRQFLRNGDFSQFERVNPKTTSQRLSPVKLASSASLPAVPGQSTTSSGRLMRVASSQALPAVGSMSSKSAATMRAVEPLGPPPPPPPPPSNATVISGLIGHVGVGTLLTMFEMEKKTGRMTISRPDETAMLQLRAGRIVHATIDGLLVPLESQSGPESVYYLLAWKEGAFEFTPCEISSDDQVGRTTTELLMEGARRRDEKTSR
jgi:hypothetical protein